MWNYSKMQVVMWEKICIVSSYHNIACNTRGHGRAKNVKEKQIPRLCVPNDFCSFIPIQIREMESWMVWRKMAIKPNTSPFSSSSLWQFGKIAPLLTNRFADKKWSEMAQTKRNGTINHDQEISARRRHTVKWEQKSQSEQKKPFFVTF